VVGVLADFCGASTARLPVRDRRFIEVDADSFSSVMATLRPSVEIEVNSDDPLEIEFTSIADFTPESLLRRVPILRGLVELRTRLLEDTSQTADELDALLRLHGLTRLPAADNTTLSLDTAVDTVDSTITEWLRKAIRHPDFRSLESTWRALWYLIAESETSESLRIEILDLTKRELFKELDKAVETDQSFIFKKLYEDRYGSPGGTPFGVVVGDYQFSYHPQDIGLISAMAAVAAATHAPFVAAASAEMFGIESYQELLKPRDPQKVFQSAEYAEWRSFRESEDARWVVLTLPEMLLRTAAHYRSTEPRPFIFDDNDQSLSGLLWGNASFALAACMTRAFARESWLSRIQGAEGGRVVNLPAATVEQEDGSRAKVSTSFRIDDRLERILYDSGFAALIQPGHAEEALFFAVPTCQRARVYDSTEATGNARVLTRLPAVMVCARFAQYLKAISRDRIGSFTGRSDHERYLNQWLARYVSHEPVESDEQRAKYPLREGSVSVTEMPGAPGYYQAMLYLRPQYGLDGLTVSLRVPVTLSTIV
jgi:type VI secretion system protein ImpC